MMENSAIESVTGSQESNECIAEVAVNSGGDVEKMSIKNEQHILMSMKADELNEHGYAANGTVSSGIDVIKDVPQNKLSSQAYPCIDSVTDSPVIMYHCPVCMKLLCTKKSLKFHMKTQHATKSDKHTCPVCGKEFKAKIDLDRHVNIHNGVRPHTCAECDKSFICLSSLNRHRKLQHLIGDIYKCHVCEKSFRVQQDLNRHLHTHTGVKPWSCDLCTKSFTCKSSLNVHRRSHDDSKKLSCQFCEKRFHIKMDLVRHEANHTGDQKWQCSVCLKKYSGKSALKRHIKDTHFVKKSAAELKNLSGDELMDILKECNVTSEDIESCIIFKGEQNSEDKEAIEEIST